jgi:hypothetical protein
VAKSETGLRGGPAPAVESPDRSRAWRRGLRLARHRRYATPHASSLENVIRDRRIYEARKDRIRAWSRVVSPTEYRKFAQECLEWAKTARSDRERDIFLQMSETWIVAAALAERRQASQDSSESDDTMDHQDVAKAAGFFRPLTRGSV